MDDHDHDHDHDHDSWGNQVAVLPPPTPIAKRA
jgi:hypothetical protein